MLRWLQARPAGRAQPDQAAALVVPDRQHKPDHSPPPEPSEAKKPAIISHQTADHGEVLAHNWRVERLTGLGVPPALAEAYAERLDWHQVARLVQRGCPPRLALRIVL